MTTKTPSVGCGAAITNDRGELLLIQRLREPEAGAWGLPGGKVDFGETTQACVVREIFEELGVTICTKGVACVTEIIDGGDGEHWVSPVYNAVIVDGEPSLCEPDKHGGWGWFALEALPDYITTPTRDAVRTMKGLQA